MESIPAITLKKSFEIIKNQMLMQRKSIPISQREKLYESFEIILTNLNGISDNKKEI